MCFGNNSKSVTVGSSLKSYKAKLKDKKVRLIKLTVISNT